ncbi:transposase DNA-binding-containing protein [Cupriavidus sp. 8B]
MATESTHWAATEFARLDLGAARLDKRARILMERLAADPMASVPKEIVKTRSLACATSSANLIDQHFLSKASPSFSKIVATLRHRPVPIRCCRKWGLQAGRPLALHPVQVLVFELLVF